MSFWFHAMLIYLIHFKDKKEQNYTWFALTDSYYCIALLLWLSDAIKFMHLFNFHNLEIYQVHQKLQYAKSNSLQYMYCVDFVFFYISLGSYLCDIKLHAARFPVLPPTHLSLSWVCELRGVVFAIDIHSFPASPLRNIHRGAVHLLL